MRNVETSAETTERTTRSDTEACSYPQVIDLEEEKARRIERMEAERAFVAPLILLPVRCICNDAVTFASDGLCPECRRAQ